MEDITSISNLLSYLIPIFKGQLGNGHTMGYSGYPLMIESFSDSLVQDIDCGHYHSLALLGLEVIIEIIFLHLINDSI